MQGRERVILDKPLLTPRNCLLNILEENQQKIELNFFLVFGLLIIFICYKKVLVTKITLDQFI